MAPRLNETALRIMQAIKNFYTTYHCTPTIEELALILDMKLNILEFHLDRIWSKDFIDFLSVSVSNRRVIVLLAWE